MNININIDVPIRHRLENNLVSNNAIRVIIIVAIMLSSRSISEIVIKAILIKKKAIVNKINRNSGSTLLSEKGFSQYTIEPNILSVKSLGINFVF